jgi:hypothetical protein
MRWEDVSVQLIRRQHETTFGRYKRLVVCHCGGQGRRDHVGFPGELSELRQQAA